jgi:hypothetical protein
MRIINSKFDTREATEFYVVDLDDEPVKIDFKMQVIDIIVSSPDIDVLIGWDYKDDSEFTPDNSLLVKTFDNMKEIAKEMCTHFYLMPYKKGTKGRVFVTVQR